MLNGVARNSRVDFDNQAMAVFEERRTGAAQRGVQLSM